MHDGDRKTVGENLEDIEVPKDQDVVYFPDNPISKEGGLAILRGSLSPNGSVVKVAGIEIDTFKGPANVFDSEQEALDALINNKNKKERWLLLEMKDQKEDLE